MDPIPDPILAEEFLAYKPAIEPGTSWMAVRHANHYAKDQLRHHKLNGNSHSALK